MTINVDELYAQRAETTGVAGDRVPFEFAGKKFSFRDPLMLSDDDKEELAELSFDSDIAEFYLGPDEYDRLLSTSSKVTAEDGTEYTIQGGSSVFFLAFRAYQDTAMERDAEGKSSRPNRSSRRKAARKRAKRH